MTTKVLLVDDHAILCDGLKSMLEGQSDFEVVGQAGDGRTALELVKKLSPDVVVMDIGLPELNGIDTTVRVRAEFPGVKVLALSMHTDKRYVHRVLEAGATGYLLKMSAHEEFLTALRAVSQGKTYLSPEIAAAVLDHHAGPKPNGDASAYATLGAREREVLQLVAEGNTSAQTADKMHISIKTVETHRRNIVQKLGLHGTANLTKYAIREGLTSTEE